MVSLHRSQAPRYSRRAGVPLHNYCTVCLVTHDPAECNGGERKGRKGGRDTWSAFLLLDISSSWSLLDVSVTRRVQSMTIILRFSYSAFPIALSKPCTRRFNYSAFHGYPQYAD